MRNVDENIEQKIFVSIGGRKYGRRVTGEKIVMYDDYEFLQDLTIDFTRRNIVAFVGENDDVVPVSHVHTHYKTPIILKGEGHRLNDLYPIIDMIKSMVGNFPEHTDDNF